MAEPSGPAAGALRPFRPDPAGDSILSTFRRGKEHPRGVVWFGARSFWGHLRHFIASAIATEDVDSRDWMTPDDPEELGRRIAHELGGDDRQPTLLDALGRDLWIDFLADTGDDVSVSRAVARLVFAEYELPDPDRPGEYLEAPRGEILIFGGDTAYPVATAQEITNRVIAPFNQVLETVEHAQPRVLLGIPGNHDWYDGLDGFQRLFRRRDPASEVRQSVVGISQAMLQHYAEWAREFVRGGKIEKPKALGFSGYTPVQSASYFSLPLTRHIELLAVDRQLRTPDSRQCHFLQDRYRQRSEAAMLVLLPDPLYRFGTPSKTGTATVESLQLDFEARDHFILTGDVHHYQRTTRRRLLHVVAGGGGAFLHPTRLRKGGLACDRAWPGPTQCRRLLRGVPFKIARGRSGLLPHLVLFALFSPAFLLGVRLYERLGVILAAPLAITLVLGLTFALIGGVRRRKAVLPLAFAASGLTAALPIAISFLLSKIFAAIGWQASLLVLAASTLALSVGLGVFVFGAYLALLTTLGFEHTQAFTALDHPGFKHFVRLRVRADQTGIDGYCLGLADPLGDPTPVLVDTFTWRPNTAESSDAEPPRA